MLRHYEWELGRAALEAGANYTELGTALSMSKQGAARRYGPTPPETEHKEVTSSSSVSTDGGHRHAWAVEYVAKRNAELPTRPLSAEDIRRPRVPRLDAGHCYDALALEGVGPPSRAGASACAMSCGTACSNMESPVEVRMVAREASAE